MKYYIKKTDNLDIHIGLDKVIELGFFISLSRTPGFYISIGPFSFMFKLKLCNKKEVY